MGGNHYSKLYARLESSFEKGPSGAGAGVALAAGDGERYPAVENEAGDRVPSIVAKAED
jgi:hypothetical protein